MIWYGKPSVTYPLPYYMHYCEEILLSNCNFRFSFLIVDDNFVPVFKNVDLSALIFVLNSIDPRNILDLFHD